MNHLSQLLTFLLLALPLRAATINAASASQVDVDAAISTAVSGDTVAVPAGSATWTATVTVPIGKILDIQGAGTGVTNITTNIKYGFKIFNATKISGFSFTEISPTTAAIEIESGIGWRIHHCDFTSTTLRQSINVIGTIAGQHPTGVIDHCNMTNCSVLVSGWGNLLAHAIWNQPSAVGTANAVYVEDCSITGTVFGNAIDGNYGGMYVLRHCTITDLSAEAHSFQSYATRGFKSWEIYENAFVQSVRTMNFPLYLRSGTGVIFNNTFAGTWSNPDGFINCVRASEWRNTAGFADGGSAYDANTALSGGSGTHTGAANAAVLTDSSRSWTVNGWVTAASTTGTHTGSNNAAILTGAGFTTSGPGGVSVGYIVKNTTDGSLGRVTAVTNTTLTATLTGGAENDWDTGDAYEIRHGQWIYNTTDGSKGVVISNTATTATAILSGGSENDWDAGDAYYITDGWPSRDQPGRGPDSSLSVGQTLPWSAQASEPIYYWGNTQGGAPLTLKVSGPGNAQAHIVAGRDFFTDGTQRPGYTPYTYPHPLTFSGTDVTAPTVLSASIEDTGTTLTIQFSENVTGVNSAHYTLSSGSLSSAAGAGPTWTMTLSPTALGSDAARTLSYTAGTTVDTAASPNSLANFSGATVINNSIQTTPLVPGRLRGLQILAQ